MSFFGGLAEGLASGTEASQRAQDQQLRRDAFEANKAQQAREFDLALRKYAGANAKELVENFSKQADGLLTIAETAVKNGKGDVAKQLFPAIERFQRGAQVAADRGGLTGLAPDFTTRYEALVASTLSPEERAKMEGQSDAQKADAAANTARSLGTPAVVGANAASQATTQAQQETALGLPGIQGAAEGTKKEAAAPAVGRAALSEARSGGAQAAGLITASQTQSRLATEAKQPGTLPPAQKAKFEELKRRGFNDEDAFDVASGLRDLQVAQDGTAILIDRAAGSARIATVQGVTPAMRKETEKYVNDALKNVGEVNTALMQLSENPGATGIRGAVVEKIGGLLGQITDGNLDLGAAKNQELRTQLRSLIGANIRAVTGDASGRYSDQDQKLASAAMQATELTAAPGQIRAALETLRDVQRRGIASEKARLLGADASMNDRRREFVKTLRDLGTDIDSAAAQAWTYFPQGK